MYLFIGLAIITNNGYRDVQKKLFVHGMGYKSVMRI